MTELLKIFSPLTAYKVEVFMKAAEIHRINSHPFAIDKKDHTGQLIICHRLLQNFEQLSLLPLKKEMFVCEVEEPKPMPEMLGGLYNEKLREYRAALSHLLFEGFEMKSGSKNIGWFINKSSAIELFDNSGDWQIWMNETIIAHPESTTIKDLIYHLDKYNETASSKISITPTESWVKRIIK